MVEIIAQSKYLRVSPKKLEVVAPLLKGLNPKVALTNLQFLGKRAAQPLAQSIQSALANATHNLKLKEENLRIKTIEIAQGPRLKRWRPVSRGSAHEYKRRTSHIKVVLEEVSGGSKDKS